MISGQARTKLSDSEYICCLELAEGYLRSNASIRNREIRKIARISYDQAICFFKRATEERRFLRRGTGGGTFYVPARVWKQSRKI